MIQEDTFTLLLGHGSRAPGADQAMHQLAENLKKRQGLENLMVCTMEGLGLPLQEAIAQAYAKGHRRILVLPYFLHMGNHLLQDVPEILDAARETYPDLQLHLGRHLCADEALADLVQRRLCESLEDMA